MIARLAASLVVLAGCVAHAGAHRIDPARVTADAGWIVAAPTPELRQRSALDCGAASLAMVAGRWEVPISVEATTAVLPAETAQGVRLGDLRDAARALGLDAFAIEGDRATLVHELGAGRPVIVGLLLAHGRRRALSHYEVVVAVQPAEDRFVTIDPALGWRVRTWGELDTAWRAAGRPTLVVVGIGARLRAWPIQSSP